MTFKILVLNMEDKGRRIIKYPKINEYDLKLRKYKDMDFYHPPD